MKEMLIILVLGLLLSILAIGYKLKVISKENESLILDNSRLSRDLNDMSTQINRLLDLNRELDKINDSLNKVKLAHQQKIKDFERDIKNIEATENDTDSSLHCLDVQLPFNVKRMLNEQSSDQN